MKIADEKRHDIESDWTTCAGYRAVVMMHHLGHRCGYVGIPKSHCLHGVGYSSPRRELGISEYSEDEFASLDGAIEVHGGITYSGGSDDYPIESDGLWWLGFDCAHAGDLSDICTDGVARTKEYVTAECESMARQLLAIQNAPAVEEDDKP